MESNTENNVKQQQPAQRIQIYPPTTTGVSPFWIGAQISPFLLTILGLHRVDIWCFKLVFFFFFCS